jgi:hypothetical protein
LNFTRYGIAQITGLAAVFLPHWLVYGKHAPLMQRRRGFMRKIFLLAILATAAGIGPALAQANCDAPIAPLAPNGRTVSQQQLSAAITDAKNFIAQSDVYQQCLLNSVKAQKDQAVTDKKPFDPYIETTINKKIDDNQKTKIQVGNEINTAVNDYKTAHPR